MLLLFTEADRRNDFTRSHKWTQSGFFIQVPTPQHKYYSRQENSCYAPGFIYTQHDRGQDRFFFFLVESREDCFEPTFHQVDIMCVDEVTPALPT